MEIDLSPYSDEELRDLTKQIADTLTLRERERTMEVSAAEQVAKYLNMTGRVSGQPWVQPTGAHDAYPKDWEVTFGGKTWVSSIPSNVWEPGSAGWREKSETPAGDVILVWKQPLGAVDAYRMDETVLYKGRVYRSDIDANVWEPGVSGWTEVIEDTTPEEPIPVEDWAQPESTNPYQYKDVVYHKGKEWRSDAENNVWEPGVFGWIKIGDDPRVVTPPPAEEPITPPATTVPEWVQPTGAHDVYAMGARVSFNGKIWESTVNNNSWSPTVYGWKEVTL